MPDGVRLQQGLMDALREMREAQRMMAGLGRKRAEAEREYRVAIRTRTLWEREKGTPATYMSDVVRGYQDIAQLRLERDVADAEYEANREAVNVAKKTVDTFREVIAREYAAR